MAVEVGKFTTEVTMLDRELPLSSKQIEVIVQEVSRRILRANEQEQQRANSASFDGGVKR